jgi:nitrate reductase gamma subunit
MEKSINIKVLAKKFLFTILFSVSTIFLAVVFSMIFIVGCSSFKERINSDLETKVSYLSGKLESCLKKEDFFLNF